MQPGNRRHKFHGLVGALGAAAALGGFVGNSDSATTTIVLVVSIVAGGATLVNVFTDLQGKG